MAAERNKYDARFLSGWLSHSLLKEMILSKSVNNDEDDRNWLPGRRRHLGANATEFGPSLTATEYESYFLVLPLWFALPCTFECSFYHIYNVSPMFHRQTHFVRTRHSEYSGILSLRPPMSNGLCCHRIKLPTWNTWKLSWLQVHIQGESNLYSSGYYTCQNCLCKWLQQN